MLFTHVFSGRGAFIQIGVVVGTIMAANVFMVIIPNQRKITAALIRGETPDPRLGAIGKQRSLHNTYLTLPVLLMMISNHFAMLTDAPNAWLLLGLVFVGGAALRHFLVRHEVGDPLGKIAWTLPVIVVALGLAWYLSTCAAPVARLGQSAHPLGPHDCGHRLDRHVLLFRRARLLAAQARRAAEGRRRRGLGGPWRRLLSRAQVSERASRRCRRT